MNGRGTSDEVTDRLCQIAGSTEDDAMNFAMGDVVELKSGGPTMTIEHVGQAEVTCVWYDYQHSHEMKSRQFRPETLKKINNR
jgi:uncharacterized protein YodC (DUF2158 family)